MTTLTFESLSPADKEKAMLFAAKLNQESPPTFVEFFSEAVFITDAHRGLIQVERWPHLLELAEEWGKGESQIVLKARQIGVSYLLAAFVVWKGQYFPGSRTLVFSQGQTESHEIINKAADIYENQPLAYKVPLSQQQKGRLSWKGGGVCMAFSSSSKAGRGFTGTVILDEAATHPNPEEHYAAMRPVLSAGGQFLCVSTAQGAGGWFHDIYQQAKARLVPDAAKFVPWNSRPDRDDEWLRNERQAFAMHPALFRQEYPSNDEEAFISFSGLVFGMNEYGEETLSKAANIVRPPCRWEDYKYRIAGIDPGGRDPTAIVFLGVTHDERLHAHFEWVTKKQEPVGADEIAAQLWRISAMAPLDLVVVDPSNRILVETLIRMGFRADSASRVKPARIDHMTMLFRTRRLTISPWCQNLVEQLFQYFWDERDATGGGGKSAYQTKTNTDKHHADAPDALGYAMLAAFRGISWKTRDDADRKKENGNAYSLRFG